MKEPEKYKQPEEETTRLSEPTVAYNSMAYLELEAEKAELIRTIANIDSKEMARLGISPIEILMTLQDQNNRSVKNIFSQI